MEVIFPRTSVVRGGRCATGTIAGMPGCFLWRVIFSSDHSGSPARPPRHLAASEGTGYKYLIPSLSVSQCLITDLAALF